jgi:acetylcholinesterase
MTMMFTLFFISLLAHTVIALPNKAASPNLTIKTTTGTFTGLIDPKFPSTRQFRSIPFAQPPTLSRRWLPPQKLSTSSQHYNSTTLPPSCPQFVSSIPSLSSTYFAEGAMINNGNDNHTSGLSGAATSEDCLYLAIWTPSQATPTAKLPVLFFMTGGGFQGGGVNLPYQLPTGWVDRSQAHIVVTINYRLNIFGFPNALGLADQNLGMLDQRAALEWVRDNIVQFGGDAKRITQWGQSAGSMSADAHAHTFYKDPIASAYILQSGTLFSGPPVVDTAHSNFTFVARNFGCYNATVELDCMRAIPFPKIINFIGQYGDSGAQPALSFIPAVDNRTIFSDYPARIAAGKVAHRPTILSNTANELSSLIPFSGTNVSAVPQEVILAISLAQFVCPTYNSTVERNGLGIPVFRYQYAGMFPNMNPFEWLGAHHGSDVPMNFGTYGLITDFANATKFEEEVSRKMQQHILAFASDPWKGPQKIGWKPMIASDAKGGSLVRFGADEKAVQYVDGVEVDGVCQGIGEYDAFP